MASINPEELFNQYQSSLKKPAVDPSALYAKYQESQSSSPEEPKKKDPSLMQQLDMINTGVHRGVTRFTHKLMSLIPNENLQKRIKAADAAVEAEHQKNISTYDSWAPHISEIGGEVLATLPLGGLYGKLFQSGQKFAKYAPQALKGATKAVVPTVGAVALGAAEQGVKYNPDGSLFDVPAAVSAATNPATWAFGAAGTKLSKYSQDATDLGVAKQIWPDATMRDIAKKVNPYDAVGSQKGRFKTFQDKIISGLPAVFGMGHGVRRHERVGQYVDDFISNLAGTTKIMSTDNLVNYTSNKFKKLTDKMVTEKDALWKQAGLNTKIQNRKEVTKLIGDTVATVKDKGLSGKDVLMEGLRDIAKKKNLTVDNIKQIRTDLRKFIKASPKGGMAQDALDRLSVLRGKFKDLIHKNLGDEKFKDYLTASEFQKQLFDFQDMSKQLKDAFQDEVKSRNLVRAFIGKGRESFDKNKALSGLNKETQQALKATYLAKVLQDSSSSGKLQLNKFLYATSRKSEMPRMLGDYDYKVWEGLHNYLREAVKPPVNIDAGLAKTGLKAVAAVALSPAIKVANSSPLKRLLYASTQKISPSAREHLNNLIGKQLRNAGMFIANDGTLEDK